MDETELLNLRQQYAHLDNYQAWLAAGRPCDCREWPLDEVVEQPSPPIPSELFNAITSHPLSKKRGTGHVTNRIAIRRGQRERSAMRGRHGRF